MDFSSTSCLSLWSLVLVALLVKGTEGFVQCYYPDGSIPTDYIWVPCTSGTNSACCVPAEGDICQDTGLCYYPPNKALFRGACTDPTWQAPECPKVCLTGATGYQSTWVYVLACSNDASNPNYACGGHSIATCAAGSPTGAPYSVQTVATVVASTIQTIVTSTVGNQIITQTLIQTVTGFDGSAASTHPTSAGTGTGTAGASAATGTGTAAANSTKGLATGAIIGIAVGGAAVLLILSFLIFFFLRRKKRSLPKTPVSNPTTGYDYQPVGPQNMQQMQSPGGASYLQPYQDPTKYGPNGVVVHEVAEGETKPVMGSPNPTAWSPQGTIVSPATLVGSPNSMGQQAHAPTQYHEAHGTEIGHAQMHGQSQAQYAEADGRAVQQRVELDGGQTWNR